MTIYYAKVEGFDNGRAKLTYDDGQTDMIRMPLDQARMLLGERIQVILQPMTTGTVTAAATEAVEAKRGRKPGSKNVKRLTDKNGKIIKDANGKTFKSKGIYAADEATEIVHVVEASKGEYELEAKKMFQLKWLSSGKRMTDGFKAAWESAGDAGSSSKPVVTVELDEEGHPTKRKKVS